jgi:5'-nucleotidase
MPIRHVLVVLLLLASAACAPLSRERERHQDLVHLTFLQINDVYELEPVDGGRRGGMARLATLVKATRRENPDTLFVVAGDVLAPSVLSTFLKGEPMIAALNAVGVDLATFGNHEFDFGPTVLSDRMRQSTFTWLSANVLDRRTGQPFGGARRDLLRQVGPVVVGVLGLTMPETLGTSSPGPDVVFEDVMTTARAVAADLRRRGAKVVVAVTHQDMRRDRALAEAGGIDLILGGHEHEPLVAEQGRAVITKAGSDARYLVRVDVWVTLGGEIVERSWSFREVSARVPPDPDAQAIVKRYVDRLDQALHVVIGRATVPLEARRAKLRGEEANTGNFITDVMRARMGTEVALLNGGGVRADRVLPEGPITKRDIVSMLPFVNAVMKLEMTGRELRAAIEYGLAQTDRGGGGFLQLSGARIAWDPGRPAGRRLVRADVGGAPLDDGRRYTVAVIDYLYRGGDGFTAFRDAKVLVDPESGPALMPAVVDAITERGTIAPGVEGRITRLTPAR